MARVLTPDSKLATARRLSPETADPSLSALLDLGPVAGNEMLAMLDWLLARQKWIQTSLANRHLKDATLILYDVSSSYLEGRLCPLAAFGYNRDGEATIGRRLGEQANRYKVRKHFALQISADSFAFERNLDSIAAEARLDGLYAIRTSLPDLVAEAAVEAYKSLSGVERAFRTSKDHLRIRPIHVYSESHVRGHVFLCMLAYYVEWHMRRRLAPLLFQDDDPAAARAQRDTPVEPAEVSEHAHHCHRANPTPAPGLRPAESRTATDCFHNRDRLRVAPGEAKASERNKLCNKHGLNLP